MLKCQIGDYWKSRKSPELQKRPPSMSTPPVFVLRSSQESPSTRSSETLSERAYEVLLNQMRDGTLASGMFLSMPVLVDRLGFPIAAVREAVKRAEASGLVSVLPKRGISIMAATPQITQECLELRALLDCEGARRLLSRPEPLPLADMRKTHEALLESSTASWGQDSQKQAIRIDLSLHNLLASGLDNDLMARIYQDNRDRIAIIQIQRPFLPDRISSAITEHLDIIAALEARDIGRTVAAIMHHHHKTLRWWGIVPTAG